jgi:hypothetical protein
MTTATESLEAWAAHVAPTLTTAQWDDYRSRVDRGMPGDIESLQAIAALLAHRDRVAAGLSPRMREALPREGTRRDCTSNTRATLRALAKRGLGRAWQPYCVGSGRSPMAWKLTDFGREIARVLAQKETT